MPVGTDEVCNKCPTNFSLSPGFDKLKLVGQQAALHQAGAVTWSSRRSSI